MMLLSSAPGRRVWLLRFTLHPRDFRFWFWTVAQEAARPALPRGLRIILDFRLASAVIALMARAANQAQKFGVEMAIPDEVASVQASDGSSPGQFILKLSNNETARARAIIIASGARYRRIALPNLELSRVQACTTGRLLWKESFAADKRWPWWAPEIRRVRRLSIWPVRRPRSGSLFAARIWRRACRAIWSTASVDLPTSRCCCALKSPAWKAPTA